jgi:hypothetical protein
MAAIEYVLEGWAKKCEYHSIVIAFHSKPTNRWDPDATLEALVDPVLMLKLKVVCLNRLQLDGNDFFQNNMDATVNGTYGEFQQVIKEGDRITHQKIQNLSALLVCTCHQL